jgi:putative SOS response-associated peptidase YedK
VDQSFFVDTSFIKSLGKVPVWIYLKNREPFGLAGLRDVWRNPNGKQLETFTIIITEPNELLRPIHNQIPVILKPEDEDEWLDVSCTNFGTAQSCLKPFPDEPA